MKGRNAVQHCGVDRLLRRAIETSNADVENKALYDTLVSRCNSLRMLHLDAAGGGTEGGGMYVRVTIHGLACGYTT